MWFTFHDVFFESVFFFFSPFNLFIWLVLTLRIVQFVCLGAADKSRNGINVDPKHSSKMPRHNKSTIFSFNLSPLCILEKYLKKYKVLLKWFEIISLLLNPFLLMELVVISTALYFTWDDSQMQLKHWHAFPFSDNLLLKWFMPRGVSFKQKRTELKVFLGWKNVNKSHTWGKK